MARATQTAERRLLSYPLTAAYLGISVRAAKQLAADGVLRKVLIGHRVLFDIRDLDTYVDDLKRAS